MILDMLNISLAVPQATATAAVIIGVLIVALFGLVAYLFIRIMIWWWDNK